MRHTVGERLSARGVIVLDGQVKKVAVDDVSDHDDLRVSYWRAMLRELPAVNEKAGYCRAYGSAEGTRGGLMPIRMHGEGWLNSAMAL